MGSQTFVSGRMGLGTAACPPTDSAAGKPALAADPSPAAWHPDSRGASLSPSLLAFAGVRPKFCSGLARIGIQVDSFHASQPSQQGSSQFRPARPTAGLDGAFKWPQTTLGTAAATAADSATAASTATQAASVKQSCQR
ncbi:TPA: hypothetical protein ACH3X1_009911 [Trebouxia sp. C0004]